MRLSEGSNFELCYPWNVVICARVRQATEPLRTGEGRGYHVRNAHQIPNFFQSKNQSIKDHDSYSYSCSSSYSSSSSYSYSYSCPYSYSYPSNAFAGREKRDTCALG